jgi:hypothetical protein
VLVEAQTAGNGPDCEETYDDDAVVVHAAQGVVGTVRGGEDGVENDVRILARNATRMQLHNGRVRAGNDEARKDGVQRDRRHARLVIEVALVDELADMAEEPVVSMRRQVGIDDSGVGLHITVRFSYRYR